MESNPKWPVVAHQYQISKVLYIIIYPYTGLALECYVCDTDDDGNKCKEKDPKTDKLDRYISDDKDTCYACQKATYEDGSGKWDSNYRLIINHCDPCLRLV